jgi:uncharacterized protein
MSGSVSAQALFRLVAVLAAALALFAPAAPSVAQSALPHFPALTGRVVDEANILTDRARVELGSRLAALEAKTGDRLVVVTLRSLRGQTVDQYAAGLARDWQSGNNGALLIVAPWQRQMRIEVSSGLEEVLSDAVAQYIIEQEMLLHIRTGDIPGGLVRGVDDIVDVLTGDAAQWQMRAAPYEAAVVNGPVSCDEKEMRD